jgi:transposase
MAAEIISTVERRRHWPDEEKLRILSEALAPGATVAAVADGNGVCRSLVYLWLRLARAGRLPGISLADPPRLPTQGTSFVSVRIEPPGKPAHLSTKTVEAPWPTPDARCPALPRRRPSVVEIVLGNGRSLKVDDCIDPAALARLVAALDREAS